MFFLNLNWDATEKWAFFLESVYSLSKGSFSSWGDVTPEEDHEFAVSTPDYDFSTVNEYSDLDYKQLNGTLGVNYKLDKRAKVYGSVNLMDLKDDQEYVYGDLTGAIITYAAGMTVGF